MSLGQMGLGYWVVSNLAALSPALGISKGGTSRQSPSNGISDSWSQSTVFSSVALLLIWLNWYPLVAAWLLFLSVLMSATQALLCLWVYAMFHNSQPCCYFPQFVALLQNLFSATANLSGKSIATVLASSSAFLL